VRYRPTSECSLVKSISEPRVGTGSTRGAKSSGEQSEARSTQKSWRLRMPCRAFGKLQVMSHEKGALREHLDDEAEDGRIIALQSLSNRN
jgi:hypothetical protein